MRCDCGYDFHAKEMRESFLPSSTAGKAAIGGVSLVVAIFYSTSY